MEEENKPLNSPSTPYRTSWSHEDGSVPILSSKKRLHQGKLHPILTSVHLYYSLIIIIIIALYMTQRVTRFELSSPPTPFSSLPLLCGSTSSEALAMGCVFDVYITGWLPAACYDPAVAELSQNNMSDSLSLSGRSIAFPIYWDEEMTRKASLEDVMTAAVVNGEDRYSNKFHTAWEYHRAHCLHLWRLGVSAAERLARGERSIGVYYNVASPEHVEHCKGVISGAHSREPTKYATITPGVVHCIGLDDAWDDSYGLGGRRKHT
ncbi:hypothetical protein B0O99DRAFT_529895 [Bisporella sp. PMI_857]|nr:hypothetical protein B0O99DRAFT_529895 [Bisporella sp. PMI_857]